MNSELSSYWVQPQPFILWAMEVNKTHSCTQACFDSMCDEVCLPYRKKIFMGTEILRFH